MTQNCGSGSSVPRIDAYLCFEVQDEFVVGHGLDYKEEYRNLPFVAVPELEKPAPKDQAESH